MFHVKTLIGPATIAALFCLAPLAAAGEQARVGYYDMNSGQGVSSQVNMIETPGYEAVQLFDVGSDDLADIDVLLIQNPSNFSFGSEYVSRLADIEDFINGGGCMLLHDRSVTGANNRLPGGENITFIRDTSATINIIDDTTRVTDGPGGALDDSSLDGGFSSSHGYAPMNTLPDSALAILSHTSLDRAVTFTYPTGNGAVTYSTIPLDFYLARSDGGVSQRFREVYAPNVMAHVVETCPALEEPETPEACDPDGRDTILGGDGSDHLSWKSGDTCAETGGGNNNVIAGTGDDTIIAGDGTNQILLEAGGNNRVVLDGGINSIIGGPGDDEITGSGDNSIILSAGGNNTVSLEGTGDARILGGSGDDNINAGPGNHWIIGFGGDNRLEVGAGESIIIGGTGTDVCVGPRETTTFINCDEIESPEE